MESQAMERRMKHHGNAVKQFDLAESWERIDRATARRKLLWTMEACVILAFLAGMVFV